MSRQPTYDNIFGKDRRRRELQKAKRATKRNREPRPPRRNDWMDLLDEEEDAWSTYTADQRIMPRDERERQQAAPDHLPGDDAPDQPPAPGAGTGLVVEVSTGLCRVHSEGQVRLCSLRGALTSEDTRFSNVVAVGDRVVVSQDGAAGGAAVEEVLPRRTLIARPDPSNSNLQQVMVANVDQLLIVAAWREPHIWPELIDRYLITAARYGIAPLICVNKVDLAESRDAIEAKIGPYRVLGHHVLLTSAATGEGLDALRAALAGTITALAGLSGVGKSTLLTAIQPDFALRTAEVNHEWGQGRHTTTQATMLPFGPDGYVIDTPGIREFGLAGLSRAELAVFYPEFAGLGCRFSNCAHLHEPDCAVREGVRAGRLSPMRYHAYRKILETLPE